MKFTVDKNNYKLLPRVAELLRRGKPDRLEITLTKNKKTMPSFPDLEPFLYKIFDYEKYFEVWLMNVPYCAVNEYSRDHILVKNTSVKGVKPKKCSTCKYFKICPGFLAGYIEKYGKNSASPIPDLPIEVMIEAESRCNFKCGFCFNKVSFAGQGRNLKKLSTGYLKKVIRNISDNGIKTIRFTGGEPLLRKDIFELMAYAKKRIPEIRLNTNGSPVNSGNINYFKNIVDNVLIPIESWNNKREAEITGCADALSKKISAIKLFKKIKIPVIRIGTVASRENIHNIDKLGKLILSLPINEWEFYRPISWSKKIDTVNNEDIEVLVEKIIDLRKKTGKQILIANALPFCVVDGMNKINTISSGALFDDGHNRLVVDPRGFVKPHYFMDKNLGDPLDIMSAWNHPFAKKMRNLRFLPKECNNCRFVFKCRGGSRFEAKLRTGSYSLPDPLAQLNR